jgi:protein-disulfide isomerase
MTRLKVPVSSRDHIQGSNNTPITLVEYGDYQCQHCGAAQPVVKQIQARFGERLRLVYRHFPLVEIHPLAGPAAEVAEFAGAHGQFWEMHDAIFANQHRLSVPLLISLATNLGLSNVALRDALAAGTYAEKIQSDFIGGVRSGVNGTPTFFVNDIRYESPLGVAGLAATLDQILLAGAKS